MCPPSASASHSARASRFRVQGSRVRAPNKKVSRMGKLVAVVYGAVVHSASFVTSLVHPRR